jgi:hypothetical protein
MRGSSSQSQTTHNRPDQQKQLHGHHRPRNAQATKPKENDMILTEKEWQELINWINGGKT